MKCRRENKITLLVAVGVIIAGAGTAGAVLELDPPVTVQDGGVDLSVLGYSVPTCADWDNDERQDLIVGEGGGGYPQGKVRIYLNIGTAEAPAFAGYVYAMSEGSDLVCPAAGCQGVFPRVVDWDGDERKDLLIGAADGTIFIYRNVNTDADPQFDGGANVQAGTPPGDINIGYRATPIFVDWNLDGRPDLLIGAVDGLLRLYLDTAVSGDPQFAAGQAVLENGSPLTVPGGRSSPEFADFDGDGRRDLLVGNTAGQILLYANVGTNAVPVFSGYTAVLSEGQPIDLPGEARSRPCMSDWTNRGHMDVLVGSVDGLVHVYGGPEDVSSVPPSLATIPFAAYPNPFNPRVNIAFVLAEPQTVELAIFSIDGRRVASLAGGQLGEGEQVFTWDGRDTRGRGMPTGQYIVRLSGSGIEQQRKITLLR